MKYLDNLQGIIQARTALSTQLKNLAYLDTKQLLKNFEPNYLALQGDS